MAGKKPKGLKGCVKKAKFWHCPMKPRPKVDRRSIRTIRRGKVLLRIGCPTGEWSVKRKRCKVGTVAISKLVPV